MSYNNLIALENIFDDKEKLIGHSKYYKSLEINGLHYVYYDRDSNTIAICHPNHRTHHLATTYIIKGKNKKSINTIKGEAYAIKKFLDFLMIWDINLNECDILYVLFGFVSYLRCIPEKVGNNFERSDFLLSNLKKIPLNESANSAGKVLSIGYNKDGFMKAEKWKSNSYNAISKIVSKVISYITFLQEKTKEFEGINLNLLPRKKVNTKYSLEGGTLGDGCIYKIDIDYILTESGFKKPKSTSFTGSVDVSNVLRLDEVDKLIDTIPSNNYQNKLLFTILKCFGLREGEACSLHIDTSKLNPRFMYMDKNDAINELKENLKGDIEFSKTLEKWVCYVRDDDGDTRFDTQSKTGNRIVSLCIPNSNFEEHLLYGLIQRDIILTDKDITHDLLLIVVSDRNGNKGKPLTGSDVYDRYRSLAKRLYNNTGYDLRTYCPHSIRHFYATHMITNLGYSVFEVSKLLGHASVETTIKTYFHFINPNKLDDATKSMYDKYKEKEEKLNGATTN